MDVLLKGSEFWKSNPINYKNIEKALMPLIQHSRGREKASLVYKDTMSQEIKQNKKIIYSWAWWHTPIILAHGSRRQEDYYEFQGSLCFSDCLSQKTKYKYKKLKRHSYK